MEFCRTVVDRAATFTNFEGDLPHVSSSIYIDIWPHGDISLISILLFL